MVCLALCCPVLQAADKLEDRETPDSYARNVQPEEGRSYLPPVFGDSLKAVDEDRSVEDFGIYEQDKECFDREVQASRSEPEPPRAFQGNSPLLTEMVPDGADLGKFLFYSHVP